MSSAACGVTKRSSSWARATFHEGTRWGALGEVAELFVNKDRYDAMICRNCTHVELFLGGGIAERPEE
jgi:hypothetical protein